MVMVLLSKVRRIPSFTSGYYFTLYAIVAHAPFPYPGIRTLGKRNRECEFAS